MESGLFEPAATGHDERRCGCVLSQLNADPDTNTIGDYYHQLDVVGAMADPDGRVPDDRWAAEHGFDLETADYPTDADEAAAYRQLTAEWHQAMSAGQGADPVVGGWSA